MFGGDVETLCITPFAERRQRSCLWPTRSTTLCSRSHNRCLAPAPSGRDPAPFLTLGSSSRAPSDRLLCRPLFSFWDIVRKTVKGNALFARARAGDASAVDAVVRALRPRLSRLAAHYARATGENPDDLLQEAWLGLLGALPELDLAIGSPDQYLIQRARWRLLDAVKRARLRRCLPLDDALLEPAPDALPAVGLRDFMAGLKANQRAVLDCLLRGLTWRETGDALGCTSANVAYHVRQIQRQYHAWDTEAV